MTATATQQVPVTVCEYIAPRTRPNVGEHTSKLAKTFRRQRSFNYRAARIDRVSRPQERAAESARVAEMRAEVARLQAEEDAATQRLEAMAVRMTANTIGIALAERRAVDNYRNLRLTAEAELAAVLAALEARRIAFFG